MTQDVIVKLENVTKIYKQGQVEVKAVDGLSFDIRKGDFTVLCGPSGSGKTTVLNLIGALDSPTGGKITFEGNDISLLSRTELSRMRRDRIGFVFQSYNLVPVLTRMRMQSLSYHCRMCRMR